MTIFSTLVSRGNVSGFYVRPPGSDSYPPKADTRVDWVLSQPVQDLLNQGKRLGLANKGTIGNADHLRKHGDHTGHSYGKERGIIYAKDTELPNGGKGALLKLCRTPDYDTSWIDFFNVEGRQYNYAGEDVGPSGDEHLHVSTRRGAELVRVTLFEDMAAVLNGTWQKKTAPPAFHRLGFVAGAALVKVAGNPAVWLAGRGKRTKLRDSLELLTVRQYMQTRGMDDEILPVAALTGTVV